MKRFLFLNDCFFQIASLKNQIGALDKVIESGGMKTLGVELKSKISALEKKFQVSLQSKIGKVYQKGGPFYRDQKLFF